MVPVSPSGANMLTPQEGQGFAKLQNFSEKTDKKHRLFVFSQKKGFFISRYERYFVIL